MNFLVVKILLCYKKQKKEQCIKLYGGSWKKILSKSPISEHEKRSFS